ncbi:MAG: hypothetical protein P4N59_11815 [Negativicutes bacterium]|nr:hypothetical protein [Negativicutes bacterium]
MKESVDKLEDYVTVNQRLIEFWQDYPEGRVETILLSHKEGVVIVKAEVYARKDDTKPIATGHAHEQEGSSEINATSALENCETSAVGRALAIAGYEIKKAIASREEVAAAKSVREDPGEFVVKWKDFEGKIKDLPPKRILWLAANYTGKDNEAKKAAKAFLEQNPELLAKVGKSA